MIFSTQYYKPPFPTAERWREDLKRIAEVGFDTVYLTVTWAWIETEPDRYRFDDYDELMDLAGGQKLKVVLNTLLELQPTWIHRLYPDASMVDHMGRRVVSSQLSYAHFGLSPGCCMDNPQVRSHAGRFMEALAARYAQSPHLGLWDCWNEMRWMSQADGQVCYCEHTQRNFRDWLRRQYGSLEKLNRAWIRRYTSWDDIVPAKAPTRTYTDSVAWQHFVADDVCEKLRWRYERIRAVDEAHPIIAHAAFPSVYNTGEFLEYEPALGRGNDWRLAREVDGYGCSHFPAWIHTAPSEYGARVESARCATGEKPYWIAELQGGAAGHGMQAMEPVPGALQARWIWNGIARGAKAVNFWCWRDEGFGRESGGFGIIGEDGHAAGRLRALKRTAQVLRKNEELLDEYRPIAARIGVVFEPTSYQLDWAAQTAGGLLPSKETPYPAGHSVQGYLHALERLQIPYDVVETSSPVDLKQYQLMLLPWPLVINEDLGRRLVDWVAAGGTLVTEGSLDAFNQVGLFKFPGERPLTRALGFSAGGRRKLEGSVIPFNVHGVAGELRVARWREDLTESDASDRPPQAILDMKLGSGRVYAMGSFVGLAYWEKRYEDFEHFLYALAAEAAALPEISCARSDGETLQWRLGHSRGIPLLFVINGGEEGEVQFLTTRKDLQVKSVHDIVTGRVQPVTLGKGDASFCLPVDSGGYHVWRFG